MRVDGLALIQRAKPSLAIVDITLKGSGGLDLLKDMRVHEIELPVLVLSMHDESLYAERALRAGAKGYITKHEASAKVMIAIRSVLRGEIYLDQQIMARILRRIVGGGEAAAARPIDRLTDRELAVFELIGEGRTTREIGGASACWPNDRRHIPRAHKRKTKSRERRSASCGSEQMDSGTRDVRGNCVAFFTTPKYWIVSGVCGVTRACS